MSELVELFVGELPQRTESLLSAMRTQQWEMVQRISHQLKGASAGYGFPTVGDAAAKVEEIIKAGPLCDETAIKKLNETVNALITLCQRVRA